MTLDNLSIQTVLANESNFGCRRSVNNIKYLVIHYTGNDGDNAKNNANYFKNNIVKASAHYFVDDNSIYQSVPDDFTAYSVGGKKYADADNFGGGKYYGKCTNTNSISIELCDTVKNGISDFSNATLQNATKLCRHLINKYNISYDNIIRHYDVTGKLCPKPFIDDYDYWVKFKTSIITEVDTMTEVEKLKMQQIDDSLTNLYSIFNSFKDSLKKYKTIDDVPFYAQDVVRKCISCGAIKGDENGELNLSDDIVRLLVILSRKGVL